MNDKGIAHDKFTDIMLDICPVYTTKEEIINKLLIKYDYFTNERQLRKMFEHYNKEYEAHHTDRYFIAHSRKGYKITRDTEDIRKSIKDNHKRAITILARETKIKRAMGEDLNIQDLSNEIDEQIKKSDTAIPDID